MEANGEFTSPSPQERIRQAALGLILDAQQRIGSPEGGSLTNSRSIVFMLEVGNPQEDDALSVVTIRSDNHLAIAVTQFREDLSATDPKDVYEPTDFTWVRFSDPFDSEMSEGDNLPVHELNRVAEVLESEDLEEINFRTLSNEKGVKKAATLVQATLRSNEILIDRISTRLHEARNPKHAERSPRVRKVAARLRRVLKL